MLLKYSSFLYPRGGGGGGGDGSMFRLVNEVVKSSIDFPEVVPVFP